jgi:hypothetical protein
MMRHDQIGKRIFNLKLKAPVIHIGVVNGKSELV